MRFGSAIRALRKFATWLTRPDVGGDVVCNAHLIRLATLADAPDIAAMARDYIERGLPWRWDYWRVAKAIKRVDVNVAVVGGPGAVIGFGVMSYGDDVAHLQLLAVRTARQRQGVARAIVGWLEAVARTAGARRIHVEARLENVAARSLYNELGYHEQAIERLMYHGVVDGVRLEKWLVPAVD